MLLIDGKRPPKLLPSVSVQNAGSSRILEKQNSLQMSEVFPLRASLFRWALLFKDSRGGTEETDKVTGCPPQLNLHAQFKNRTLPAARGIARPFNPQPIAVPRQRGRFTQPMLLLRGLDTPTPCWSEARPR